MKLMLVALLTLASFVPATAQNAAYTSDDETTLQQCIEAVNDTNSDAEATATASMHDCIGTASDLCQQAPGGSSSLGIVECVQREAAWWDSYLNSNYAALQSSLEPALFDSLKLAQRAWLKYRDANCDFVGELWAGGSIAPVMAVSCQLNTTASRAIELADALNGQ